MMTRTHPVRFLTPAFLGNAEQCGQWRTPPFKAQLRQWWRVAYAADCGYRVDLQAMRREEGLLFGNAWLSHRENGREVADHRKSLLRLRLGKWTEGLLTSWGGLEQGKINHPEAEKAKHEVGPHAYLGYGPLDGRGNTKFSRKNNAAIQAGESATLSLAVPTTHKNAELRHLLENNGPRIERSLWLMDRYGTVGGRSRNGWGSYTLLPLPPGEDQYEGIAFAGEPPLRPWHDCLQLDWPHAIGKDEQGPLIWETAPHGDWKSLMRTLAIIKIGLRTQFVFPTPPHVHPLPRHWLSYPITRHSTKRFDRNARLPNQLRFKVRATAEGRLIGVIFHVPHLPPAAFRPNRHAITATWKSVHRLLDELTRPAPRGYTSITDSTRRAQLKPQLDSIASLRRISE